MGIAASRWTVQSTLLVLAIALGLLCSSCSTSASAACRSDAKPLNGLVLGRSAVPGSRLAGPETFDLNDGNDPGLVALENRLAWDPSQ
ncbi:MAG TPA: hypothetical protein VGI86_08300, partial [Acidimicrobiia bacterium]